MKILKIIRDNVTETSLVAGMDYQEVFVLLKKRFNTILMGISKKSDNGGRILHKNPYGDMSISTGDYLVLITSAVTAQPVSDFLGVREGG